MEPTGFTYLMNQEHSRPTKRSLAIIWWWLAVAVAVVEMLVTAAVVELAGC
jgi:hypothetical protein